VHHMTPVSYSALLYCIVFIDNSRIHYWQYNHWIWTCPKQISF